MFEVEVGIDRVYGAHAERKLYVFRTCKKYIDEKGRYARKLDDGGQPTEVIENKNSFHIMDAERYVIGSLFDTEDEQEVVIHGSSPLSSYRG